MLASFRGWVYGQGMVKRAGLVAVMGLAMLASPAHAAKLSLSIPQAKKEVRRYERIVHSQNPAVTYKFGRCTRRARTVVRCRVQERHRITCPPNPTDPTPCGKTFRYNHLFRVRLYRHHVKLYNETTR